MGRSRGGFSTKIHVAVDALGYPLELVLTAGQEADITQAAALLAEKAPEAVIADKGYDADALIATITAQGSAAVIPPRSNRTVQRDYDQELYRERNVVERFFNYIKHFRRIATRYEKTSLSYLAMLTMACVAVWLR